MVTLHPGGGAGIGKHQRERPLSALSDRNGDRPLCPEWVRPRHKAGFSPRQVLDKESGRSVGFRRKFTSRFLASYGLGTIMLRAPRIA